VIYTRIFVHRSILSVSTYEAFNKDDLLRYILGGEDSRKREKTVTGVR
jgi:hypothetical protein